MNTEGPITPAELNSISSQKPRRDADACLERIYNDMRVRAQQGHFESHISPSHISGVEAMANEERTDLTDVGIDVKERLIAAGFCVRQRKHMIVVSWGTAKPSTEEPSNG